MFNLCIPIYYIYICFYNFYLYVAYGIDLKDEEYEYFKSPDDSAEALEQIYWGGYIFN